MKEEKQPSFAFELLQDINKQRKRLIVSNLVCGVALILLILKRKKEKSR